MAKNPLKWKEHQYYPLNSSKRSRSELSKEYNRLREVAKKRIERLGRSEFSKSQAYKQNINQYNKPASSYTNSQLSKKLYQLSRFISSEQGSVRGQQRIRKKSIERLHQAGYDFINKDNFDDFGQFMEDMRARAGGRLLDSDRVAEVFGVAQNLGVDNKSLERDFEFWQSNKKELEKLEPIAKGKKHNSTTYLQKLDVVKVPDKFNYYENVDVALKKMPTSAAKKIKKKIKNTGDSNDRRH